MDSQLSDLLGRVACVEESARRGDWIGAGTLSAILKQQTLPAGPAELGEYLRCLKQALVAAKVSRAHLAASLARVKAAARFNKMRLDIARSRQEFGEVTEF